MSMGAFCCHGNQIKRQVNKILAFLDCPHPSNICTKLESYCCHLKSSFFKIKCCHDNQTKWPLVIKHINWVDKHQMIITAKYGSHHFSGYGENAVEPFSHYKSMGAFCCHGNQTKSQITIILAIFKSPYQSNILTILGTNRIRGFGDLLKVLTDGRTDARTEDGQKMSL